jgi:hypothetical protein
MATTSPSPTALALGLALGLAGLLGTGCAASVCARKASFFESKCGGRLSYSDPYCESNYDRCSDVERAQIEGYVACLEASATCSQDVLAACQAQFPGGVNKFCQEK